MILIALFSLVMIVMLPKLMDQSLPLHPLPLTSSPVGTKLMTTSGPGI